MLIFIGVHVQGDSSCNFLQAHRRSLPQRDLFAVKLQVTHSLTFYRHPPVCVHKMYFENTDDGNVILTTQPLSSTSPCIRHFVNSTAISQSMLIRVWMHECYGQFDTGSIMFLVGFVQYNGTET